MKTKIAYISDLHLEHYGKATAYEAVVKPLLVTLEKDTGVVIFSGDIFSYNTPSEEVFNNLRDTLQSKGYVVIHVNGNHEFYSVGSVDTYKKLNDTTTIKVNDLTILAGTYPPHSGHISWLVGDLVNDYYLCCKNHYKYNAPIDNEKPYMTLQKYYDEAHSLFLQKASALSGKLVFATHFRPWFDVKDPYDKLAFEYPRNVTDPVFPYYNVMPETRLVAKPIAWIHGHSHDRYCIEGLDGTVYLNNCLGYPDQFASGPNWEYFEV